VRDNHATERSRRPVSGIPAGRAKTGAAHVVPLSAQAQAILRAAPRLGESDLVFPGLRGPFSGFSKAKAALDKASGVTDWRLHDLRRTMATGLQRLGVRLEVTEAVLNHIAGNFRFPAAASPAPPAD
jgi:integrase